MKNIKKLLSNDLSENEVDSKMSDLLNDKFNDDLRKKYSNTLEKEYGVTRAGTKQSEEDDIKPKSSILKFLIPILLVAASLLAYFLLGSKTDEKSTDPINKEQQIERFFAANELAYIDNTRNNDEENEQRSSAVSHFQNKDYQSAAVSFSKIPENQLSIQDRYYLAYSQLRSGQYAEASKAFTIIVDETNQGDNYHPESKLYQIISLLALKENDKAKSLYNSLEEGSWEKKKLMDIMK